MLGLRKIRKGNREWTSQVKQAWKGVGQREIGMENREWMSHVTGKKEVSGLKEGEEIVNG